MSLWIIWLVLAAIFLVIELATLGLATVWCVVGAIVAAIADYCGASLSVQIVLFCVISVVLFVACLIWLRPMLDKRLQGKVPTNSDKLIGKNGTVIKNFSSDDYRGLVRVQGQEWTAVSSKQLREGDKIVVNGIEGIKLIVEEKN
ncbi:MAG: NfeD family protein [Clostridia bacterium]|nr:NfeD family protein [Clostridia bacterium]